FGCPAGTSICRNCGSDGHAQRNSGDRHWYWCLMCLYAAGSHPAKCDCFWNRSYPAKRNDESRFCTEYYVYLYYFTVYLLVLYLIIKVLSITPSTKHTPVCFVVLIAYMLNLSLIEK